MSQLQHTNVHQLRIGDFIFTTLLDAQMEASFGLVQSISEEEARRLHAENGRPNPPRITLNAFLLETGDHQILIDTGIDASAIDTVLITHMHPDHIGGLIDADDQPVFPEARGLQEGKLKLDKQCLPSYVSEGVKVIR